MRFIHTELQINFVEDSIGVTEVINSFFIHVPDQFKFHFEKVISQLRSTEWEFPNLIQGRIA